MTRGPARKVRFSTGTPSAAAIRPDATPTMAGACVRFVMYPMRTAPSERLPHAATAAAHAPARRSRRVITTRGVDAGGGFGGLGDMGKTADFRYTSLPFQ